MPMFHDDDLHPCAQSRRRGVINPGDRLCRGVRLSRARALSMRRGRWVSGIARSAAGRSVSRWHLRWRVLLAHEEQDVSSAGLGRASRRDADAIWERLIVCSGSRMNSPLLRNVAAAQLEQLRPPLEELAQRVSDHLGGGAGGG